MTAQVAADLRAAADVLERDGWTQGVFTDKESGCHCAAGALAVVISEEEGIGPQWTGAVYALCESLGLDPWPTEIYHWNDAPGRTADEVIATLRAAADRAEATA